MRISHDTLIRHDARRVRTRSLQYHDTLTVTLVRILVAVKHYCVAGHGHVAARLAVVLRYLYPPEFLSVIQLVARLVSQRHILLAHGSHQSPPRARRLLLVGHPERLAACLVAHTPHVLRRRSAVISQQPAAPAPQLVIIIQILRLEYPAPRTAQVHIAPGIRQLPHLQLLEYSLAPHLQVVYVKPELAVATVYDAEPLLRRPVVAKRHDTSQHSLAEAVDATPAVAQLQTLLEANHPLGIVVDVVA